MTKGLDELIERLVAETAYCGETGLSVDEFITLVSRLKDQPQQKTEPDIQGQNGEAVTTPATDALVDMPLARKAWEWLVERPEILVGRNGSRGKLSLDDALALPAPQMPVPVSQTAVAVGDEDAERKVDLAAAAQETGTEGTPGTPAAGEGAARGFARKGKKQVAFTPATKKEGKQQPRRGAKAGADEAAAAAAAEDPHSQPRLYVTERTLWHALTGHDVDYKKVPLLEWKCLQGIASARQKGILQADLRILVNQDKRSVPKRTDFLAAKGYAVKRTTIARGYRTSMLWLTEFAPIELPDGDEPAGPAGLVSEAAATPSLLTSNDLASSGIDFSPEFLKKNLEPVPWRDRWIGDAIEFASFGQTVLAIVKAWGVMRVIDLKIKMGIIGKRWQMRTLARVCREFVASGILRFVAAMHPDERKMFKDCIKFERDPTPTEWAVYLAAGRRRTPMTDLRAKQKKEQDRQRIRGESLGISIVDGDDTSLLDPSLDQSLLDLAALEEEEEYEFGESGLGAALGGGGGAALAGGSGNGSGTGTGAASTPAWAIDIPLVNLIYDTVDRAGIDGITSPEICRATLGTSFSRYIFTLVTAMARPGSQPAHLQKFQLHCESTRVGRNNAYLFRTLENANLAESLARGASLEDIDQQTAAASADQRADATLFWDLHHRGVLQDLPPDELRRLYGFAPPPAEPTAEELEHQQQQQQEETVQATPQRRSSPTKPKKLGRPKKVRHQEEANSRKSNDVDGASIADADTMEVNTLPPPPKRKRGRPPKPKPAVEEIEEIENTETAMEESISAATEPDSVSAPAEEPDKNAEPLPTVRFGESGSLSRKPKASGRPRRSIVTIFRLDQLRNPEFLVSQQGYKEGAPRLEPEDDEGEAKEQEEEEDDEQGVTQNGHNRVEELAASLAPVVSHYNGKPGHLTVDLAEKTLLFTYAAPRRGRPAAKPKEAITINVDNLVGDPVIRRAPGSDGQALILEVRQSSDTKLSTDKENDNDNDDKPEPAGETTWPFVFILDAEAEAEDNAKHTATLRDVLVALKPRPIEHNDDAQPVRRRGRQPGKKNKKAGKAAKVSTRGADTGPKEFICETCSGVWKNLLGLQYHQTKSRTACNPNYVPPPPEDTQDTQDKKKKKRKDEAEQAAPRAGDEGETPSLSQTRGRRELRKRKPLAAPLDGGGGSSASATSSRSHSPSSASLSESDAESCTSVESPSRPSSRQRPREHGNRRMPAYHLAVSEDNDSDNGSGKGKGRGPRGIAGAVRAALNSRKESAPAPLSVVTLEESPAEPVDDSPSSPELEAAPAKRHFANESPTNGHNLQSRAPTPVDLPPADAALAQMETYPSPPRASAGRTMDPGSIGTPTPMSGVSTPARSSGPAGFRMAPLPKSTTSKLSPFAVRSLIVMEITKYLVDCFDGVFPSDRSLWYAAFRVYTRSFPGEDPPTLTATKAAIKKLEMAKEVEEHTFGFRDPRGQFIYCRLLARPGVDLFHSESAVEFKRQVQAAYPQPYVPDEFVPSEKDMAVLRILDKDIDKGSTRNTRGRRPLAPGIEVLNAPFYEQQPPQAARQAPNTVLLVGYGDNNDGDDGDDGEGDEGGEQLKPSNLKKRKDVSGGAAGQGTPKRRRTRFADAIAGHTPGGDNDDDDDNDDNGNGSAGVAGNGYADLGAGSDNEANIDPALRTVKMTAAKPTLRAHRTPTKKTPKTATTNNPGLDSLPASFFVPGTVRNSVPSKGKRPVQQRDNGGDGGGFTTFVHFLPPNTHLEDGQSEQQQQEPTDFRGAGQELARTAAERVPPRQIKFVTKTHVLRDQGKQSPRAWPVITETSFQRQSDASFSMDGFMPTRKALLRANLPRTPAECAAMLRGNQKITPLEETPESQFLRDLEYCRSWEMSQMGTDILRNASVAPRYVFLNVAFQGEHYTAEMAEAEAEGLPAAKADAIPPLRWMPKNQYTIETIPYGMLDLDETASAVDSLVAPATAASAQRKKTSDMVAVREKQAQQAKYVTHSRREMTAYPQKPEDYIRSATEANGDDGGGGGDHDHDDDGHDNNGVDWSSNDTLIAAFVVVKTLLGGVNQAIDWGLLMRLFPGKQLSTLRAFWTNTRRERQPHIDKLTERFQQAFLAAYNKRELPPLDFDNVLAYDWPRLIGWALPLLALRHDGASHALPATREALLGEDGKGGGDSMLADVPPVRTAGWREDFFHVSRSVWNRLQDSASEAASLSLDRPLPITPAEVVASIAATAGGKGGGAAAAGSVDLLRNMVARSWIRALCGTPHKRYPPSQIKQKLLTLGAIGAGDREAGGGGAAALSETDTNNLLQTVIGNLTTDRILRRTKSLMALGGRMYTLTEAYDSTLEKMAMEAKFLQAWKFKEKLDGAFRRGRVDALEIPLESNDDGMVMALLNMQAHGRITLEAVDAPHIPFGFEPGNYESRKFPKHYQRFRLRIKPTVDYAFNEHEELDLALNRLSAAWSRDSPESNGPDSPWLDDVPPKQGPHQEMPIWRDFFGELDHLWFARLTGAVIFSLATRGATSVKQTTAHLRPIVEPFEVQMLMDWATRLGILAKSGGGGSGGKAGNQVVTEWWWLLVGKLFASAYHMQASQASQAHQDTLNSGEIVDEYYP
ncbi:hypothetical protein SCUCBS95973_005390 [Sporothrix curviconia]|uniref:TFIIIC transcription initiation factor complex subunits Tfc3 n=1 Tax=Sporothrix curviconia TaxID=1260050 RepID=A0ABP0BY94_9PEZI